MQVIPGLPNDRFLSFLPLSHALERTGGYYLPMMAGACVYYARSVTQLAQDLLLVRPTILIAVPRIFERLQGRLRGQLATASAGRQALFRLAARLGYRQYEWRQGRRAWSPELLLAPLLDRQVGARVRARLGGALRVAVTGGAPMDADMARLFLGLGLPLVQGYGLTEASPVVTLNPLEDNRPDSIGRPLPGVEIRIGPEDELQVRSPGVTRGYWRQAEASAALLDPDGWLRTGDQARLDAAGHVFLSGRLKDLIVLANGEKLPLADLELTLARDELIAQVLVVGERRPFLAALAVLEPDAYPRLARQEGLDPDLAAGRADPRLEKLLLRRLNAQLHGFPGYAKIRRVAVVEDPWSIEQGTMTPTMKLRRARILERHAPELQRLYAGHQSRDGDTTATRRAR